MNALALVFIVVAGILLNIAPSIILRRDALHVTVWFSLAAILSVTWVGGLLCGVPFTIIFAGFLLWLAFVARAAEGWKRTAYKVTRVAVVAHIVLQVIHLPIRLFLHQSRLKVEINVAAIVAGAAMACAVIEWAIIRRKETAVRR